MKNENSLVIQLTEEEQKEMGFLANRVNPKGKTKAAFNAEMRKRNKSVFALDKKRAISIGVTHYVWRSTGDADVCEICKANDGKVFAYNEKPEHGHAGCGNCKTNGYCRCYAEAILPE